MCQNCSIIVIHNWYIFKLSYSDFVLRAYMRKHIVRPVVVQSFTTSHRVHRVIIFQSTLQMSSDILITMKCPTNSLILASIIGMGLGFMGMAIVAISLYLRRMCRSSNVSKQTLTTIRSKSNWKCDREIILNN